MQCTREKLFMAPPAKRTKGQAKARNQFCIAAGKRKSLYDEFVEKSPRKVHQRQVSCSALCPNHYPCRASFVDMVALKGATDIGDQINQ